MKHNLSVTLIIIAIFILAQAIGLLAVKNYVSVSGTGQQQVKPLPAQIERPTTNALQTVLMIVLGILIGTVLAFLIIRTKKTFVWNAWFGIAVFMLSYITLYAFFNNIISIIIAIAFAIVKSIKTRINRIIRNIPELFIYAGFAILFSPLLPVWAAAALLLLISVYDAIAVWKSKHMVSLAKFQLNSGSFAGININYNSRPASAGISSNDASAATNNIKSKNKAAMKEPSGSKRISRLEKKESSNKKKNAESSGNKSAILGGGDIAFPLLFSASVLMRIGWAPAIIATLGAATALFGLLAFSKKDTFYPAMPFITAGAFIGFGIGLLVLFL